MANYTKRDQRTADMREAKARETDARYTIFSNDFDPALRTPNLTLGQAIRVLASRSGCKVYFESSSEGLGVGFRIPQDASQIAPTAGTVRLNIRSVKTDIIEAKKCSSRTQSHNRSHFTGSEKCNPKQQVRPSSPK